MIEKIIARIIELNNEIEEKEKELKSLKTELIESDFEKVEHDWYIIYTTTRMTPVLKEGVSEVDIMMDFPDVVKTIPEQIIPESKTIDMKLLAQLPSAQKLLEIKSSKSITVKKGK